MVGLNSNEVRLEAYSPEWPKLFDCEAARVRAAVGSCVQDVQHIGSTAVPGLSAKPVIDMALQLCAAADLAACRSRLEAIGYVYKGEHGLPGRHFFILGDPVTHHLHVVAAGSEHWLPWVHFRDRLRASAVDRQAYVDLKADLARRYAGNREAYTAAKHAFIVAALAEPPPKENA